MGKRQFIAKQLGWGFRRWKTAKREKKIKSKEGFWLNQIDRVLAEGRPE